jgi:hypothetical protein
LKGGKICSIQVTHYTTNWPARNKNNNILFKIAKNGAQTLINTYFSTTKARKIIIADFRISGQLGREAKGGPFYANATKSRVRRIIFIRP